SRHSRLPFVLWARIFLSETGIDKIISEVKVMLEKNFEFGEKKRKKNGQEKKPKNDEKIGL
ncbi:hypothetical protein ACISNY_05460, partial [Campylobacter jejuni]